MHTTTFHPPDPGTRGNSVPNSGRRTRPAIALFLALTAVFSGGCAKIGDPQPPEIRIPLPASDLNARQVSDFIVLTFAKPERNTNGSEVTTLRSVHIYRLAEDPGLSSDPASLPQDEFMKGALRVMSIPSSRFQEYLQDNKFTIQDRLFTAASPGYSRTLRYAVLFVNNKNQAAGLSNQALIRPIPIPSAPAGISAEATQDSIKLKWTAPAENMDGSTPPRIAGYRIYRSEEPGKLASSPRVPDVIQLTEFEDRDFRFDTTYYYAVSTVGNLRNPDAESLPSAPIRVDSRDTFPPAPPSDFNAILQAGTAVLLWTASPSSDVAGYRIYRKEKGTAARQLVQQELIPVLSFRDAQVEPGKEYEYEIRTVDTHGNESPPVLAELERP